MVAKISRVVVVALGAGALLAMSIPAASANPLPTVAVDQCPPGYSQEYSVNANGTKVLLCIS